MVDTSRIRALNNKLIKKGPILYLMSRDQRFQDNWAVQYLIEQANQRDEQAWIVFCLEKYNYSNLRQYDFMIKGLIDVAIKAQKHGIGFKLVTKDAATYIPKLVSELNAGELIVDFSPLKNARKKREDLARELEINVVEVDAHNIVPIWEASPKQEFAAYTIRPKINKLLNEYLVGYPELNELKNKVTAQEDDIKQPEYYISKLNLDDSVKPVNWIEPNEYNALKEMQKFIDSKLDNYNLDRNNPNLDGVSGMSPYLHFGQLSAQRLAIEVAQSNKNEESKAAFLEELIIRRELSENYCYFVSDYRSSEGFPEWAKKSLAKHMDDKREYIYTLDELEQARTHDELWNAAQNQMVKIGKMHGYMRMYWAKKILEWTKDPDTAMNYAITLNDKYELDGRDPNGYTGIAWSIGGVHDRPWFDRPIYGQIRYMSYSGASKKFDISAYIEKVNNL